MSQELSKPTIAICFSGKLDRLIAHLDNLLAQLSKYTNYSQCDLFFSHWEHDNGVDILTNLLKNRLPQYMQVAGIECISIHNCSTKFEQEDTWSPGNNLPGFISQFEGIKNSDTLRQRYEMKNNFIYDLIIRSRSDIRIDDEIDIMRLIDSVNNNTILFPYNYRWAALWDDATVGDRLFGRRVLKEQIGQGMMCDMWFAAESNIMSQLTVMVDNIDQYVDDGCRLHPETVVWWHIVKTMKCKYDYQYFKVIHNNTDND